MYPSVGFERKRNKRKNGSSLVAKVGEGWGDYKRVNLVP